MATPSPVQTTDQIISELPPAVTVIIVNFNAGAHLAATLSGLRAQTYSEFRAIVVDNASSDDSISAARLVVQDDPRFEFIMSETNLGFAAANNLAARQARTIWLALLNPDALPAINWLEQLMMATKRYPKVSMFGSMQINQRDHTLLDGAGDCYFAAGIAWRGGYGWPHTALPPEGEVFSPCAAAALYRRAVFQTLGGLEESFFCYLEDVDFAFRARLQGHQCIQVNKASVYHAGSVTSGGPHSDFARYHGTRNMIWCFVRNMPSPLLWPLLPFHVAAIMLLWLKASNTGSRQAVGRGIRDAVSQLRTVWSQRNSIQTSRTVSSRDVARWLVWNPIIYARRTTSRIAPSGNGR